MTTLPAPPVLRPSRRHRAVLATVALCAALGTAAPAAHASLSIDEELVPGVELPVEPGAPVDGDGVEGPVLAGRRAVVVRYFSTCHSLRYTVYIRPTMTAGQWYGPTADGGCAVYQWG